MSDPTPAEIEQLVQQIQASKKYRDVGVADDTIRDILLTELARQPNRKAALQSAKRKLHEVIALYLGDPDYTAARDQLDAAFASGDDAAIRTVCIDLLRIHDSTRERLDLLKTFYPQIWAITGTPQTVLDIACGLNPLMWPWMGLPADATFYAYEIHTPRVDLLNHYFTLQGVAGGALVRDILVEHPTESGDVAMLLKETHRMEKRRKGIVLPLLDALDVRWIVLSSPTRSRAGHVVIDAYRQQIHGLLAERPWPITEIAFSNELVYCIEKTS
jgi:16S rRNA (guanine(1405)-N(7))-methyltransferase